MASAPKPLDGKNPASAMIDYKKAVQKYMKKMKQFTPLAGAAMLYYVIYMANDPAKQVRDSQLDGEENLDSIPEHAEVKMHLLKLQTVKNASLEDWQAFLKALDSLLYLRDVLVVKKTVAATQQDGELSVQRMTTAMAHLHKLGKALHRERGISGAEYVEIRNSFNRLTAIIRESHVSVLMAARSVNAA